MDKDTQENTPTEGSEEEVNATVAAAEESENAETNVDADDLFGEDLGGVDKTEDADDDKAADDKADASDATPEETAELETARLKAEEDAKKAADDKAEDAEKPADKLKKLQEELAAETKAKLEEANKPAPEKPKELTLEERNKLLNVYEPTEDVVNAILEGGEPAVKAVQELTAGIIKQAHTMAYVQQKQAIDALRAEYAPYIAQADQARQISEENQFFTQYPELAEHKELCVTAFAALKSSGKSFKTFDEATAALSDTVKGILTKAGVELTPNKQEEKKAAPAVKKAITPVKAGGGNGGRNTSQTSSEKTKSAEPAGAELF